MLLNNNEGLKVSIENKVIIFVHIGKTGGKSLGALLAEKYPPEQTIGKNGSRDLFYGLNSFSAGNIGLVSSHIQALANRFCMAI